MLMGVAEDMKALVLGAGNATLAEMRRSVKEANERSTGCFNESLAAAMVAMEEKLGNAVRTLEGVQNCRNAGGPTNCELTVP